MRAHEQEAFGEFFRAEFGRLVNALTLVTGSRPHAEDAAQEAFVKLYVRWRKVSRCENAPAWVRKVGTRIALRSMGRKAGATPANEPTDPIESRMDLRNAITQLTPKQRAAVILHYYDDLPTGQIAEAIGCSGSTVKVHLHNARKALAKSLNEEINDVIG
ncbi:MAG: SigE family RNA polymerase sigma factor [Actinomycetota bacterium]